MILLKLKLKALVINKVEKHKHKGHICLLVWWEIQGAFFLVYIVLVYCLHADLFQFVRERNRLNSFDIKDIFTNTSIYLFFCRYSFYRFCGVFDTFQVSYLLSLL
jgi:hypothetical protein